MYIRIHVRYLLFMSDFNKNLIFSTGFENIQISNSMSISVQKNRDREGQTDMTELIIAYSNSAKSPKT